MDLHDLQIGVNVQEMEEYTSREQESQKLPEVNPSRMEIGSP
ncbi:hypothetical protein [Marinifilum flexuosum]|nr:hypothetical protein [Marinifilum flexuosum]